MIRRRATPEPADCVSIDVELSPSEVAGLLASVTVWKLDLKDPRMTSLRSGWFARRVWFWSNILLEGEVSEELLWIRWISRRSNRFPMVRGRMQPVEGGTRITLSCVEQSYLTQMRWIVGIISLPGYLLLTIGFATGLFSYPPTLWGLFWTLFLLLLPVATIPLLQHYADRRVLWMAGFLKKNLVRKNMSSRQWVKKALRYRD